MADGIRKRATRLLAATALWLITGPALLASPPETAELDITTAKRLALVFLANGQPRAAHDVLTVLVTHHPRDPEVLITLSRAERALGRADAALLRARQAFHVAESQIHRHLAARIMAEALASDGKHTRAQIWLRRAGQIAPDDQTKAAIRRDYDYVRSRNPWVFSFRGGIAPTDNANDAPTTDEIVIGGRKYLNPSAQPIAGTEFHFGSTVTYRLPATETRQNEVRLSYDGRRVALESGASDIDPNISNSDFSFDRVTLGWGGKLRNVDGIGIYDFGLAAFWDQNGGERSQDGLRARGGFSFPVGQRSRLRIGLIIEDLDRRDNPLRSSTTSRVSFDWTYATSNNNRLHMYLSYANVSSTSSAVAHDSIRLGAQYLFSKPVMSARLGVGIDLRTSLFDRPLYIPEPRDDDAVGLSITATFPELDVYGFAPVVELRRDRVFSNVSSFDTDKVQLGVSFRSTY